MCVECQKVICILLHSIVRLPLRMPNPNASPNWTSQVCRVSEVSCIHLHGSAWYLYSHTLTKYVAKLDLTGVQGVRKSYISSCKGAVWVFSHSTPQRVVTDVRRVSESRLYSTVGRLRFVGSFKLLVSFAEYRLFYRALLQKRPTILRSLLIVATPCVVSCAHSRMYSTCCERTPPPPLSHVFYGIVCA